MEYYGRDLDNLDIIDDANINLNFLKPIYINVISGEPAFLRHDSYTGREHEITVVVRPPVRLYREGRWINSEDFQPQKYEKERKRRWYEKRRAKK